jgi:hypothetical protein
MANGRVARILPVHYHRVPHLRDGLIVAKVGHFHGSVERWGWTHL